MKQILILELLADGKRMPSAELEKAVNERGISSRTMRTAKSRIGDRLVTEKDGTASTAEMVRWCIAVIQSSRRNKSALYIPER